MPKLNKNVVAALQSIKTTGRVTREVGEPLIKQGLIEVNTGDVVDGNAAARLTEKGEEGLGAKASGGAPSASQVASSFALITNAVPPESKRGVGREAGPSKYPFDNMQPGNSFFVGNSAEIENAVKTMTSAVANANNKSRVDTGRKETVQRAEREGKKAKLDASGNKIMHSVEVPVYEYPRKFIIRGVKQGQKCGDWEAPADGALITREK